MKLNSSKMIILIFILILIIYIIKNAKIEDQTFVDPAIAESEVIQDEVYTRLEASQFIIEEIIREDQTPMTYRERTGGFSTGFFLPDKIQMTIKISVGPSA